MALVALKLLLKQYFSFFVSVVFDFILAIVGQTYSDQKCLNDFIQGMIKNIFILQYITNRFHEL